MDLIFRLLWAGAWIYFGFRIYGKGAWWQASIGAVMMGIGTIGIIGYLSGQL